MEATQRGVGGGVWGKVLWGEDEEGKGGKYLVTEETRLWVVSTQRSIYR